MNTEPLSEEELDYLNEVLLKYGNDDSVLDVSELDGFLTAIVSGPEAVMPSRWYPELWGGAGNEPEWESDDEMQRFMGLVFQHMNNTVTMLMDYPDEFEALFYERELEGKIYSIVDEWCAGYVRGMAISRQAWATAPVALLEQHLALINFFADESFMEEVKKLSDTDIETLQQKIEPAARALHAYWLAQRERAPAPIIRAEPKTGRNDPCPCGSGKKYKKCCLH